MGSIALALVASAALGIGVAATRDSFANQPIIAVSPRPDPKIGTSIMFLSRLQSALHNPSPRGITLLIVGGSCTGCSTVDLAPEAIDWMRVDRVLAVFQTDNLGPVAALERRSCRWVNIADPAGETAEALNAYWRPRFYLLSAEGTLLRIQSPGEDASEFGVIR